MPFATRPAETFDVQVAFALMLRDRYRRTDELLGYVMVRAGTVPGLQRSPGSGTFLFLKLAPGPYNITVQSGVWTPYYKPLTIPVTVPAPPSSWPAYPDIALADPGLTLDDPGQPPAYRAEFDLASLLPTAQYPFDGGATLARGTIRSGGVPLADATVSRLGGPEIPFVTGADGQYVIFFEKATSAPQIVTLNAAHAAMADKTVNVTIVRGATAVATIDM